MKNTKKDRPEAATSKRPVSARLMRRENHCKDSISQSRGKARKIFAGKGVTLYDV